jgi:hypothetical protein
MSQYLANLDMPLECADDCFEKNTKGEVGENVNKFVPEFTGQIG